MFTGETRGERWQHCDSKVPVEKLPPLFADATCQLFDRGPTLCTVFSLASRVSAARGVSVVRTCHDLWPACLPAVPHIASLTFRELLATDLLSKSVCAN